ncbi:MAG: hypothetical protein CMI52_05260 [Parcubacteria group bacterium]|nr:hypothetical protein [Parcubacteria group bacterium]|tara:strand:+ start:1737 stop:2036 length:300 start_codon:yes stop_codon:yes gene_type:complete
MDSLSSFMNDGQSQVFKIARAAQAVSRAQEVFDELYPGVAAHVRVISLKDDVLRVAAPASAVISDIQLRGVDIKRLLNERVSPFSVSRIVCLAKADSIG